MDRPWLRDDRADAYDDVDLDERRCFSSFNLPDVGENPEARSGAREFDFPQPEIPQDPGKGERTGAAFDGFFHQPRRRG